jgi:hypothetical protein
MTARSAILKNGEEHHELGIVIALLQLVSPERLSRVLAHLRTRVAHSEGRGDGSVAVAPPTQQRKDTAHSARCSLGLPLQACCASRCNQPPDQKDRRWHRTRSAG